MEAVFGVDERNKIVRKLCQRIAEKYVQCCDIVTFNADLYLLLCRENVQTFTRKIATVNDFDSSFGYRNLRIHKSAICELCKTRVTQKAETGDFQYPQPYVLRVYFL
ncbi:hypothetical protein DMI69_23900 [Escherichia coli]|nr:hypothetical protein [Escherichia coli]